MLSTTTLHIGFKKASPELTQDRLRIQNRKFDKISNKRVRFADDMEFGSFRTGQADPSNTSAAPSHYNEGDTKKGAPTLKPDIDPKDPKTLLPDTKPKDPKDPPGDKPKPSPEDDPQKPSLWSTFKKYAYLMVFGFMVIVLVGAFLRLKDRKKIKSLTDQLALNTVPKANVPGGVLNTQMLKLGRKASFHMLPPAEVFNLFG